MNRSIVQRETTSYQPTSGYATVILQATIILITVGAMKPMGNPQRADDLIAFTMAVGESSRSNVHAGSIMA